MQRTSYPYDANKALGLIGVVMKIFTQSDKTGPGDVILNDQALIIPPSLLNKMALTIPYEDIFQVQNFYRYRDSKIIIKHDGGTAQIMGRGLKFGAYEKLLTDLQVRVRAAGGGGLGLF